ncbi:nephrin-like [Chrysoperla carnea]|uniref:nephrin-like n=1 Tax=Chrysoperla carnea TaxID=189513 RepID=UPI001D0837CC|nr:nephrin-like [Chrysoperla carnea]
MKSTYYLLPVVDLWKVRETSEYRVVYDTRGRQSEHAKHWRDGEILDERAYFRTITEPATLSIDNISERDEGDYRCRIDYLKSPTKNSLVRLTVIVPPQKPTIFDDNGKEVPSIAGPYVEDGEMKLTCMVSGGRPEPSVRWWRNGTLIDSTDRTTSYKNVRTNELLVRNLQREDQHAVYTCQASNNNISQPVSASVTIEIYFKPISVEILSSNQPFSADRSYEIPCQSVGSRPPAQISWWMDGKQLSNHSQQNSADGNVSTSTLTLMPTRSDNDKSLTCRAENTHVHGGVEEATLRLNVFFIPTLELQLGKSLNPDDIEEGDDVYFGCEIKANPQAYKVLWKHNGQVIQHNQKAGVIVSNRDLALQNVGRNQAGNYTCVASNVEGDGISNTVNLKIMFKPICRSDQKRIYGVARHEQAQVLCEVESFPPPESFKWSFNNTAETIDVPQIRFKSTSVLSMSTLQYTPVTEMDYGTVMCWANNLAGRQIEPCVFHIIAAGKPDPPFNCTLANQSTESLQIECIEGFNGGQQQSFMVEVFDQQNDILQANITGSNIPIFTVNGLGAGKILKILVYAVNSKGRSEPVLLEGFTLKIAEKQTGSPTEFTPMLSVLIGIMTACLFVTVIIVGALRMKGRRQPPHQPSVMPLKQKPPISLPLHSESEELKDDKNPDVIPANKDSDYQLTSATQTPGERTYSVHSDDLHTLQGTPIPTIEPVVFQNGIPRDQKIISPIVGNEVTYAELCLGRPLTESAARKDDTTIYAQIDHNRRPPPPPVGVYHHREVVTVRTPLMGCQQESCV